MLRDKSVALDVHGGASIPVLGGGGLHRLEDEQGCSVDQDVRGLSKLCNTSGVPAKCVQKADD